MNSPNPVTTRVIKPLAFALPLLAVTLIAASATSALFHALGDEQVVAAAARATRVIALLLVTNVVLLVSCLGLRAVAEEESRPG